MCLVSMLKDFARERLPAPLLYRLQLRNAVRRARSETAATAAIERKPNPLPIPLLVSLTSFGPRFATLHLTIESLLDQTLVPDAVILWIAEQELELLPSRVRALEKRGLTIRGCPDIRSYKKLVFARDQYPEAAIATADDDLFYPRTWLQTLVEGFDPADHAIVCYRAHRIGVLDDGRLAPYLSWELDVQDERARIPSVDIMPTTGHGVLYPPECFAPDVNNRQLFEQLSPTGDDLWFYWMSRLAGWKYKKVGGPAQWIDWPTSRTDSLMQENWAGGNDRQIRSLEAKYGNPLRYD
jgi:hypothetical protein